MNVCRTSCKRFQWIVEQMIIREFEGVVGYVENKRFR